MKTKNSREGLMKVIGGKQAQDGNNVVIYCTVHSGIQTRDVIKSFNAAIYSNLECVKEQAIFLVLFRIFYFFFSSSLGVLIIVNNDIDKECPDFHICTDVFCADHYFCGCGPDFTVILVKSWTLNSLPLLYIHAIECSLF